MFDWKRTEILAHACIDLDGVLCHDPLEEDNDDGPRYEKFIREAKLIQRLEEPLYWIVSARLEKYRLATVRWLNRNGIEYGHLELLDLPNSRIRRDLGCHADFKASAFVRSGATLFIESSQWQSKRISEITDKPVYCVSTGTIFAPSDFDEHKFY